MALSKDLLIATGILVVCCVVLAVAFTEPGGSPVDDRNGPALTAVNPSPPPPDLGRPSPPPVIDGGGERPQGIRLAPLVQPTPPAPPVVERPAPAPMAAGSQGSPAPAPAGWPAGQPREPDPLLASVLGEERRPSPLAQPAQPGPRTGTQPGATPGTTRSWPAVPAEQPRPAVSTAPSPGSGAERSHEIREGETLSDIALKYYGSSQPSAWQRIAEANGVDSRDLKVGQKLRIPPASVAVVADAAHGRVEADGRSYVVQTGDSYYTIARDQLGDASRFQELARLNKIDPHELMPGDRIRLPERVGAALPAPRPAPAAGGGANANASAALPAGARWHVVEPGEVLGTISQRYYGTARRWQEIAAANGIRDPSELRAGTRLIIPNAGDAASPRRSDAAAPRANEPIAPRQNAAAADARRGRGVEHRIVSGDRLEDLARRYYGDPNQWRRIAEANPGVHPSRLIVGHKLWVPEAQERAAPSGGTRNPAPVTGPTPSWPTTPTTPSRERRGEDRFGSDYFD